MRTAGILLHPVSLPGPDPIGTFGAPARDFVDKLAASGMRWWQMLPLHPTGLGSSPYMTTSAFAGSALLLDPEDLVALGLVDKRARGSAWNPVEKINYDDAAGRQGHLMKLAFEAYEAGANPGLMEEVQAYVASQQWLQPFALFDAMTRRFGGAPWWEWPAEFRDHTEGAIATTRNEHARDIARTHLEQFLFHRQLQQLRSYASEHGVALFGDMPIFVSHQSADVWWNREWWRLDGAGQPTHVAGVPPDYFSPTGQRWGNPLYDFEAMRHTGYSWWIQRINHLFACFDRVRIDHFRGFQAYWEIPADAPTAESGRWVEGPGMDLFAALRRSLGALDIVAEDLGTITPEVEGLRQATGFPGMKVMQFGIGDDLQNPHRPSNVGPASVAYTGTHDNDTTCGWYQSLDDISRHQARLMTQANGLDIAWDMMRLAWHLPSDTAIAPAQDVLRLGSEARMNTPGIADGNWAWRMLPRAWTAEHSAQLRLLTEQSGRLMG